jgi:Fic family protein
VITPAMLKATIESNKILAELKGFCQVLPRMGILLDTVVIQESKQSSAIENIVTTQDELFKAVLTAEGEMDSAVREVMLHRQAVYAGLDEMGRVDAITRNLAIVLYRIVKNTGGGIRKVPGTKLANAITGETLYTPPEPNELEALLTNWEHIANNDHETDALIQMAVLHYQFEAIHPFTDGNGRTGRILNLLFMVQRGLLPEPILYLSSYIHKHKQLYYELLRNVTYHEDWESWILFMLTAVRETAQKTLGLIRDIRALMQQTLEEMKGISQKMPVHEMVDVMFSFPYLRIKTLEEKGIVRRQTAALYLQELVDRGILRTEKQGRDTYYVNHRLMTLLEEE